MLRKLLLSVAVIYTLALIVVTFISLDGVPNLGSSFDDKIYHFLAYAGLAGLWITFFKSGKTKQNLWLIFIIIFLFGVLLEVLQHQININRTYDNFDLMANASGVIIGTLIAIRLNIIKLK